MRFSLATLATVALATQTATADWLSGKGAYNKWHETELERWLSDHNVPYPTPADRKDLSDLVSKNWENNVAKPYNSWDASKLSNYLTSTGQEIKKGTEKNTESLLSQVQNAWHETADQANEAYGNTASWIFNTWTESQLKSFCDYHGIPNPSPRTRDSLLSVVRSNYQSAANKAGETAAYPGNWLYSQWSDSDLKTWCDERGIPVPQTGNRDSLIASIRRHSYVAAQEANKKYNSATQQASNAQESLSNQLLESWSDSQVKEWLDKNGIPVPQGSKRNELSALARKHSARLAGTDVKNQAASAYGAATSSAGNYYAQATDDSYAGLRYYYDYALNQIGFASKEAKASLSSASDRASSSLVSVSSSASSLASVASASASSASSSASKAGQNAPKAASKAASEVSASASASASSASSVASVSASSSASSLSSAASVSASKSKSSASSVASASAKSAKQEL
ncbi:hypothetical protein Q7P36_011067 [Cladosporium allicinum]